jgi:hypothetical protein
MPEGNKPVPSSVKISQLAGTYKNGGRATPAEARLLKNNKAENATAMREAKTDSNLKYGSPKRMQDGGSSSSKDKYYVGDPKAVSDKASRELEEALNPFSMAKELYGKARNAFRGQGSMSAAESSAMQRMMDEGVRSGTGGANVQKMRDAMIKGGRSQRDIDALMRGQGAITETERSVTVSPAGKKRGGRAC